MLRQSWAGMTRVKQSLYESPDIGKVLASLRNYIKVSASFCSVVDHPKIECLRQ